MRLRWPASTPLRVRDQGERLSRVPPPLHSALSLPLLVRINQSEFPERQVATGLPSGQIPITKIWIAVLPLTSCHLGQISDIPCFQFLPRLKGDDNK